MAKFFREAGLPAAAVHAGPTSAPRTTSLDALKDGQLRVLFAVDMFNEGVDVPEIDTVMMLRPTESRIVWIQQFGRGLRKAPGKDRLTVIDYIGNHRCFLLKVQTLLDLAPGDALVDAALRRVEAGDQELPPGCEVTYDLEAVNILRALLRVPKSEESLRAYCEDYRDRLGERPKAHQAFHDGYNPRAARRIAGSWFGFLQLNGFLSADEADAYEAARDFLDVLETTPMTRSYKMVTLLAMLALDRFPGRIALEELTGAFGRIAKRSGRLAADVGPDLHDPTRLKRLVQDNPVAAWVGGKGTGGRAFFELKNGVLSTRLGELTAASRAVLQDLVREIVEWRLAEYLQRVSSLGLKSGFRCKVSHAEKRPILFLPDRKAHPEVPRGWVEVIADGEVYRGNFVNVAVNVMRRPDAEENVLPEILRRWFGPNAGHPGTAHTVEVRPNDEGGYRMAPLGDEPETARADLWARYAREEIPALFGLEWTKGQWAQQGFISRPGHLFLLVTLRKGGSPKEYRYQDRFPSPDRFHWQSQNRTTQMGSHGQQIRFHRERGYEVHLFVRRDRLFEGKAEKYVYCGEVDFEQWEGEKPITVTWQLRSPLSEKLFEYFGG